MAKAGAVPGGDPGGGGGNDAARDNPGGAAGATASFGNALHLAMARRDWPQCRELIAGADGFALMSERNAGGATAMIMAAHGVCGAAGPELIELMLAHGAAATLAERRLSKTAADYAEVHNNHALAARLRALEPAHGADPTLCWCGERLKPRSKVESLGDAVRRGDERNRLVRALYRERAAVAAALAKPEFHRVNGMKNFRKELTESMGLLAALGRRMAAPAAPAATLLAAAAAAAPAPLQCPPCVEPQPQLLPWDALEQASADWHVIDLCCGKSLTAAAVALCFPGAAVTCVDRCEQSRLPHYDRAGLGDRIQFLRVDMLATAEGGLGRGGSGELGGGDGSADGDGGGDPFLSALFAADRARCRPKTAVLGMHCCGRLSVRAVEAFAALQADCVLLVPCCTPAKDDPEFGPPATDIYTTLIHGEQYSRWCRHLRDRLLAPGDPAVAAAVHRLPDVLSEKNTLVLGTRAAAEVRAEFSGASEGAVDKVGNPTQHV